jgi:putative DNA primase/helicase
MNDPAHNGILQAIEAGLRFPPNADDAFFAQHGDAALPEVERNAAVLARYICKIGFTTINKRELKRSPHKSALSALREGQAMDGALAYLVDAGWLLDTGSRDGDSAGRRKGDYAVNPAVHGG